jgi:cell division protein FtsQ
MPEDRTAEAQEMTPHDGVVSAPDPDAAPVPQDELVVVPEPGPPRPPHVAGPPRAPHVAPPERRRALKPWAIVCVALLALVATAVGLTYTPLFHAKTITVRGERRLSEQRVLRIAGIGPGTNLFHLDVKDAERRLERNPWVADAVITTRLPSTVSVTVSERRPVGLTRSADGHLLYVANDGSVLGRAPGTVILPEIEVADPSAMPGAAAVAASLPASLEAVVATIGVGSDGTIILTTRSGVTGTYGDATEAEAKGEAFKAVLDYAASQGRPLVSVDVEVPGAPTAVFADTVVASPNPRA